MPNISIVGYGRRAHATAISRGQLPTQADVATPLARPLIWRGQRESAQQYRNSPLDLSLRAGTKKGRTAKGPAEEAEQAGLLALLGKEDIFCKIAIEAQ